MSTKDNVLVAMSGGVDSSVAAASLQARGWHVTGVFMCLGTAGGQPESRGCCSPQDAADARRVAQRLGIDLFVLNLQDHFEPIVDYFVNEYRSGRTPNPCVLCNSRVKFGCLMHKADALGIGHVATGHYARAVRGADGPAIHRAAHAAKDQSYALFEVGRCVLPRMLLPVGEIADKAELRRIARSLDLHVHDKPDSQEICFVENDDYVAFLAARCPQALRPGKIVDSAGRVLGEHDGYARFTVGQRRGVRVAAGVPMYVTRIDPASATVTIGPREETLSRHLRAERANWQADVPEAFDATVQIRYNHRGCAARVRRTGPEAFEVEFVEGVAAITPGQAAVCYDGDRMLGGGWIA